MIEPIPSFVLGACFGVAVTLFAYLWPFKPTLRDLRQDGLIGPETHTPTATPPKVPNPPDLSSPPRPKVPNPPPAPMPRKPVQQILHVHRFEVCPLCGGRPTPRDIQKEPTA